MQKNSKKDFFNRIEKVNDCWEFQSYQDRDGYRFFTINGREWKAHRYSYTIHKGEIPKGKIVCHQCDNTACVNPDHLWIGTHQDNIKDKINKGRARGRFSYVKPVRDSLGRWQKNIEGDDYDTDKDSEVGTNDTEAT